LKVWLAPDAGFCRGVRLAVKAVEEALAAGAFPVQVLGPPIHNPQVVAELVRHGLQVVHDLCEVDRGVLVLPSHGAAPDVAVTAASKGVRVVDATCPLVRRAQQAARELADRDCQVVVVGDPGHAEVLSIVAWSGHRAVVVRDADEVSRLSIRPHVAVLAQTTERPEVVREVVEALRRLGASVEVRDTLCPITRRRQQEARALAQKVELMLVVGGRESANTRRLAQAAAATGVRVYHVESGREVDPAWFKSVERVGVTAGTSTPQGAIEEVLARMREIDEAARRTMPGEAEHTAHTEPGGGEGVLEPSEQPVTMTEASAPSFQRGQLLWGTVVAVEPTHVLVDIGGKAEGVVPVAELSTRPVADPATVVGVGEEIPVYVLGVDEHEGTVRLSRRRAEQELAWQRLEEAHTAGAIIEAPVTAQVKGGLIVDVGLRGFLPASQVGLSFIRDLKPYVGRTLRLRVIEVDRPQRRVVLSERAVLEEEQARREEEVWSTLAEGQVVEGTVRRLTGFGAFVDLGGADGLLHVSELSWGRVNHPQEVVQEGQQIRCKVLKLDRERKRISLGLKQLEGDPWDGIDRRYPTGALFEGKVVSLASFGAFVELEPGIEGLVHLSQLSDRRIEKAEQVVSVGDRVRVKVLKVNPRAKRISLSMREAEQDAERAQLRKYMAEHKSDRVTLGEVFGNLFTEREKAHGEKSSEISEHAPSGEPEHDA